MCYTLQLQTNDKWMTDFFHSHSMSNHTYWQVNSDSLVTQFLHFFFQSIMLAAKIPSDPIHTITWLWNIYPMINNSVDVWLQKGIIINSSHTSYNQCPCHETPLKKLLPGNKIPLETTYQKPTKLSLWLRKIDGWKNLHDTWVVETHWPLDKMADILQMIIWNGFS